jgi:predicted nucleotidyltransferase
LGPTRAAGYDAHMAVSVEETLAHLRRLEDDRRRRAELRAGGLRERLAGAVRLLRSEYGVREAILFGSLATGEATTESDVDIAVGGLASERYFEALADVMRLVKAPVDLVRLEEAGESLRDRIAVEGERL